MQIIFDRHTNRIIYFAEELLPAAGTVVDTTVVAHYGSIPAEMTLENCWRFRYQDGRISQVANNVHWEPGIKHPSGVDVTNTIRLIRQTINSLRTALNIDDQASWDDLPTAQQTALIESERLKHTMLTALANCPDHPTIVALHYSILSGECS